MESNQLLSELEPGDTAIIREFLSSGKPLRRFREMGLMPGSLFKLVRRAPLGDPIEVSLMGSLLSIRGEDAVFISVEKVDETAS